MWEARKLDLIEREGGGNSLTYQMVKCILFYLKVRTETTARMIQYWMKNSPDLIIVEAIRQL